MRYLLSVALLATPAHAQCSDEMPALLQVAKECMVQDSRKLVRSGENAESIATASLINCAPVVNPVKAGYDRCYTPEAAHTLKPAMEKALRQIAVAEVVNARAGR